jgi:small redox-active disulfide protein 2
MNVKILGTGCANCKRLEALVREVAAAERMQPEIDKVTEIPAIMAFGIMHTPGLVIDGELKASGRIPSKAEVTGWLQAAADAQRDGGTGEGLPVGTGAPR